jgi:hypothetical protein
MKQNTQAVLDDSKEIGLELSAQKTKYMFMSHHQIARQNHCVGVANTSFRNVAQTQYLGMMVTTHNCFKKKLADSIWGVPTITQFRNFVFPSGF